MNTTIKHFKRLVCASFFALLFFIAAYKANAAPLDGFEQSLVQPNGTEVNCNIIGDEVYSYMCDADGNVIVENPETGYYVYAALEDGQIVPTEYAYGIDTPGGGGGGTADLLQSDEIPENIINAAYQNSRFYQATQPEQQIMPLSLTAERDDFNGHELNNIVIFIRFNDTNYSNTSASFYNGLFNTNTDSAKNYYNEVSYGKLKLNSIFYPQTESSTILTYRDTYNASYYKANSYNYDWQQQKAREQAMFTRAIDYVKSQIPANVDLDKDNDGNIDMITFVLPGLIIPGSNQVCWPHQWSFDYSSGITINGVQAYNYNVQVEGALRGQTASDGTYTFQTASAIICHETLHILGFPDLYYYNFSWPTNKISMGKWDIMCESNGAHPSSYIKYKYGKWIDIPEIRTSGSYTLNPLISSTNNSYMLRSPRSKDEFFVVEYRRNTGNFEDIIPSTSLVVYRVLVNKMGSGNAYASTSTGTDDEVRQIVNLSSGSTTLYFSNGSNSGITISGVSANGGSTASFTVSFPSDKNLFYFKDKNLAASICTALGKSESQVTTADLASLQSLTLSKSYYQLPFDLSGLENLTSLKTLTVNNCDIENISMLSSLTNLESLQLINNDITDISPLAGLTKLKTLRLRGNLIQDYSPVQSYYSSLTTKDFSLGNKDDAIFWLSNAAADGKIGMVYTKLSTTKPTYIYCSFEKYDSNGVLIKRYRVSAYASGTQINVTAPDYIFNEDNSYIILKAYERSDYRQLIAESVIRKNSFNLSSFN